MKLATILAVALAPIALAAPLPGGLPLDKITGIFMENSSLGPATHRIESDLGKVGKTLTG